MNKILFPLIAILFVIGIVCFVQTMSDSKQSVERTELDTIAGKTNFTVDGVSFEMIRVEGDTFSMGATTELSGDVFDSEMSVHVVTLSDYYIGTTEVTQELWQAVMGVNPSYFRGNKNPVESVSWYDVQMFLRKLNEKTDKTFRLPTEAEWEFAARGGNKSKHYIYAGSNNLTSVAWCFENSNNRTYPVAQLQPNELGIYDMTGNVWEWCNDYWADRYTSNVQTNPKGPLTGFDRVRRGGSWSGNERSYRVYFRSWDNPRYSSNFIGFRLAIDPPYGRTKEYMERHLKYTDKK